jgi:hypothetical protein
MTLDEMRAESDRLWAKVQEAQNARRDSIEAATNEWYAVKTQLDAAEFHEKVRVAAERLVAESAVKTTT